jgi:hypothetical protein
LPHDWCNTLSGFLYQRACFRAAATMPAAEFTPRKSDYNGFPQLEQSMEAPANPALFVPGRLLYSVTLANKRTYLHTAYLAGLVALGIWCIGASLWAGAVSASSALGGEPPGLSAEGLRTLATGVQELVEEDEAVGAEVPTCASAR